MYTSIDRTPYRTYREAKGVKYTDTYVPAKTPLCPPHGHLKPPRSDDAKKYHGNNKRRRFKNGARKISRSGFTKGRTVADRRKNGLRAPQQCRLCEKKGRTRQSYDWIEHNSAANCPFKTVVYDEDLNVVAGGDDVDFLDALGQLPY